MKRIICTLLISLVLVYTFITPVCAYESFSFDDYEDFKTYVLNPEEYKKQAQNYNENWHTFDKKGYLDFDKFFNCKSGTIISDNECIFYFKEEAQATSSVRPYIIVSYREKPYETPVYPIVNEDGSITRPAMAIIDLHFTDFDEEDVAKIAGNGKISIKKDGYSFNYRIEDGTITRLEYSNDHYSISFCHLDKTTDDMAEFHSIYKNADESIKVLKRFEDLINGTVTKPEPEKDNITVIIIASAIALVLVAGVAVTFVVKNKKKRATVTEYPTTEV